MMFVKSNIMAESGALPDAKMIAEMEKYNNSLKDAGMLIALDGLRASKDGVRIVFENGNASVMAGPFPHPEELVSGYWTIQAKSLDDAIAWAKRAPFPEGTIEIRQIQDMSEFPPEIQKVVADRR